MVRACKRQNNSVGQPPIRLEMNTNTSKLGVTCLSRSSDIRGVRSGSEMREAQIEDGDEEISRVRLKKVDRRADVLTKKSDVSIGSLVRCRDRILFHRHQDHGRHVSDSGNPRQRCRCVLRKRYRISAAPASVLKSKKYVIDRNARRIVLTIL